MPAQVTLNGDRVSFNEGESVLELARRNRVHIPTLCHMEGHGNGVCRLCMVEVDATGKTVPACSTIVTEGMDVRTDSEHVRGLRRALLSLLFSEHGEHTQEHECELERYAVERGIRTHPTVARRHEIDRSHSAILFDPDLCVLCRRCLIACNEEQVSGIIHLEENGDGPAIAFGSSGSLGESGCTSCGACVDVCPTDALQEVGWQRAERTVVTTCPYCGVGCSIEYGIVGEGIAWARGVRESPVNHGLLCVKGKFAFQHESSVDRLTRPLIRRAGISRGPLGTRRMGEVFREATWEEALELVAARMREALAAHGPQAIAGIACDRSMNEDIYAFQRLMRTTMGTNNVDQSATLCHSPSATMLSWALGAGASTNPIDDLLHAKTLLVVGSSTERSHPVIGARVKQAARAGTNLIVVDPRHLEFARLAKLSLSLKPGSDVALFSAMAKHILAMGWEDRSFIEARTEGFEEWRAGLEPFSMDLAAEATGLDPQVIREAARMYAREGPSLILWSLGITEHENGSDNVSSLVNLALLTGNVGRPGSGLGPLRGQNNVQGGADMGSSPGYLTGYQSPMVPEVRTRYENAWGTKVPLAPGWKSTEMIPAALEGRLKVLYISGENSVRSHPDSHTVEEAFRRLPFLVVQDLFLTETAEFADVVLPAASSFEKSGTFTNTERRVQRVRALFPPPGEARADWEIYADLARRLGHPMPFTSSQEVMEEIARLTPSYAGISHEGLEHGGLQWPVRAGARGGTPILHEGTFTRGRARFRKVGWSPRARDPEHPYVLITGRLREQYHTGTMTRRSRTAEGLSEGPRLEMNPEDMKEEGFEIGEMVKVVAPRGSLMARVVAGQGLGRGMLFTTFHYRELPINVLTPPTLDPLTKTPAYKDARVRLEKMQPGAGPGPSPG